MLFLKKVDGNIQKSHKNGTLMGNPSLLSPVGGLIGISHYWKVNVHVDRDASDQQMPASEADEMAEQLQTKAEPTPVDIAFKTLGLNSVLKLNLVLV